MEDLPLGRIAALVPEFAVKDLPLGSTHDDMELLLITFILYLQGFFFGIFLHYSDFFKHRNYIELFK